MDTSTLTTFGRYGGTIVLSVRVVQKSVQIEANFEEVIQNILDETHIRVNLDFEDCMLVRWAIDTCLLGGERTLELKDAISFDELWVLLKAAPDAINLVLSLRHGADIDLWLTPEDGRWLTGALGMGLEAVRVL